MDLTVNERLVMLRTQLGLTQNEMSDKLNISYPTYRRLEKEEGFPPKYINILVDKMNVNRDWILTGSGEMFSEGGIKLNSKSNGWKDEAFLKMEQLLAQSREEVAFYQQIIKTLLPPTNSKESFQIASVGMGKILEFCDTSVRVAG